MSARQKTVASNRNRPAQSQRHRAGKQKGDVVAWPVKRNAGIIYSVWGLTMEQWLKQRICGYSTRNSLEYSCCFCADRIEMYDSLWLCWRVSFQIGASAYVFTETR